MGGPEAAAGRNTLPAGVERAGLDDRGCSMMAARPGCRPGRLCRWSRKV